MTMAGQVESVERSSAVGSQPRRLPLTQCTGRELLLRQVELAAAPDEG